jgi:lipopolysaccharide transport system permease protein
VVLAFILATALGSLFSALNVRFRDVKIALPFLMQLWMIASPIFYPIELLPPTSRIIFSLNPLTGIVEGFRASLFGYGFDWQTIAISSISLLVLVAVSLFIFQRMEDDFADVI